MALSATLSPGLALAAMGDLDSSFGSGGNVSTNFFGNVDEATSVAVQSDGKIVVVGYASDAHEDFAVARYNTDGSLDTTFDSDGKVTVDFIEGNDRAHGVAIQSDGKIVVAGMAFTGSTDDFAVVRLKSDGSLDTSFNSDGKRTLDFSGYNDGARSVAIQDDGKIVVAGYASNGTDNDFALTRFNSDGSQDNGFGGVGKVTTSFAGHQDEAYSVAIQDDDKIVVAGYANTGSQNEFALARYNDSGYLDTNFDSDGKVTTSFYSGNGFSYSLAIQDDGKIVVAGHVYNESGKFFAVARYNSTDGSPDTAFNTDGNTTTSFSGEAYGSAVTIQENNKIVVAGYVVDGSTKNYALARYDTDGSLDTTFGSSGTVTTNFGSSSHCLALAMDDTGGIFAAGYVGDGAVTDFILARYLGLAAPTLSTTNVTAITASSATSGGTISSDGDATVSARGVCWNTSGSPTKEDFCSSDGSGTGTFSSSLTGLSAGNTYYVRAYATNSVGTGYGNQVSFNTLGPPTVTTTSVTSITANSASSGGEVTADGGYSVTARGVCWNTSGSPTKEDSCTSDGSGTGSFTSSLTELDADTTYYVRAYATNSQGTAYGGQQEFKTEDQGGGAEVPTATTGTPTAITASSATVPGAVTYDGGATVTQRGVCYTKVNDTQRFCTAASSSGTGDFSVALSGLEPTTQYQVFAYGVNSAGPGVGATTTFTTLAAYDHVVFFRNKYSGQTALLYFIGAVRQGYTLSMSTGTAWQAKAVADFNHDNSPDVVGQNQESELMALVTMNNYLPGQTVTKGPYAGWGTRACGDFNGDGHNDVMWRNKSDGSMVAQLYVNLDAAGQVFTMDFPDLNWRLSTAGDFNNDGTDDLVLRNHQDGRNCILLLNNAVYVSTAYLPTVTVQADQEMRDYSIVGAIDVDLDGNTDIIWFDEIAGDLYVEYLSGVEHLRYGYLTHVPPEWVPFGAASYQ